MRGPAAGTASQAPARERLWSAIDRLERWGAEREWLGSDPYEGLNARRLRGLARGRLGRRVLIQAVKRSPLDLRRALAIGPEHDAAATGHLLSAYSRLVAADRAYLPWVETLVERLGELSLAGWRGAAWGYHFDVETRFFHYSRTTPNAIATAFAGHGLLDAHEATGDDAALGLAASAADFVLGDLELTAAGDGAYFGYFPGDRTPIHNASALAAGFLARLAAQGNDRLTDPVRAALAYAIAGQRPDGSWPYAELAGLDWVDGFHTGYVLTSLAWIHAADPSPQLARALESGYRFYAERLIDADGAPRYFDDSRYPIDSQALAQALTTFAMPAPGNPGGSAALPVLDYGLARMRNRDGSFAFQRGRLLVNRARHIRWTQAPMLDGMTALWRALGE